MDGTHYTIDGHSVPRVTHILATVLGQQWMASLWHMERGRANHACYAMLAEGVAFSYDPQSQPWIDGWRKWRAEVGPVIIAAEQGVYSARHNYAGTLDLLAEVGGKLTVIDFKNTASDLDRYQLGAYASAYSETNAADIKQMVSVEINGDGTYHMGEIIRGAELRRAVAGWLAIRAVYQIMEGE